MTRVNAEESEEHPGGTSSKEQESPYMSHDAGAVLAGVVHAELQDFRRELVASRLTTERGLSIMESTLGEIQAMRADHHTLTGVLVRFADQEDTRLKLQERSVQLQEKEALRLEREEKEAKEAAEREVERLAATAREERKLDLQAKKQESDSAHAFRAQLLVWAQTPPLSGILQGIGLLFSIYLASLFGFGEDLVRYTLSAVLGTNIVPPG